MCLYDMVSGDDPQGAVGDEHAEYDRVFDAVLRLQPESQEHVPVSGTPQQLVYVIK
jgi:hypothetical protein